MTARTPDGSRIRPCARCGALNGAEFDRCIRCGGPVSAIAVGAQKAQGWLDGRHLLATKVLLGMTSLVFAAQMSAVLQHGQGSILWGMSGVDAVRFGAMRLFPGEPFEPWRLVSAMFVHGGLLHFGMNMLGLSNLARLAEPATGSARFTLAYVTTGVLGFVASAWWNVAVIGRPSFTVGASGAIFGVLGLILGWLGRRRDPRWKHIAVQAVFYGLVFGLAMPGIDNAAHVGGLLAGIVFGFIYAGGRRRWAEPLVNAAALVSIVVCVASLIMAQRSPLWRDLERRTRDRFSHHVPEAMPRAAAQASPEPGSRPVIATRGPTV